MFFRGDLQGTTGQTVLHCYITLLILPGVYTLVRVAGELSQCYPSVQFHCAYIELLVWQLTLSYLPEKWDCAFCQVELSTKAWLKRISMSWSFQFWVGNDWRNMMIPCPNYCCIIRYQWEVTDLEVHFLQLLTPVNKECRTHVKVKLRKRIWPFSLNKQIS